MWVRYWFARQETYILWVIFICWWLIQITAAFVIITEIAKVLVLHEF